MSLDRQSLYIKMEILRSELTREYEKCIDRGGINPEVIALSQRLDQLILDYVKMGKPNQENIFKKIGIVE